MFNFTTTPPLGLYVHVPWCVRKCPYCDFNSHQLRDELPETAYIDALLTDLTQELPAVWGRPVESVFIGGGTPSLLFPEAVDRLLSGLRALVGLSPMTEVTIEANPGTVEAERFRGFRQAGINRLSIGIQSFRDEQLATLGRIHSADEARSAVEAAQSAGFEQLNIDLMYGLPGQSVAAAYADLDQAIALAPGHISHYQLTLEPGTAFHHQPPSLPDEDTLWAMQCQCQERLSAAGYEHYEVSAYAQAGRHCQHNLNYWQFGDYLGIGAGAHGKITDPVSNRITRRWKIRGPQAYLYHADDSARIDGSQVLSRREAAFEFMLNALRLTQGFPVALFGQHTGLPITVIEQPLREAEARGLIHWDIQTIRPTARGRQFLDDLVALFLPD